MSSKARIHYIYNENFFGEQFIVRTSTNGSKLSESKMMTYKEFNQLVMNFSKKYTKLTITNLSKCVNH